MNQKILYQTLEDRGNYSDIETKGPFLCNWPNTWLGEGYYFWDTFIENSHWWGEMRYGKRGYVVCKAECNFDRNSCFDLVGDTEHMLDFSNSIKYLESQKLINSNTTVSKVLAFIKEKVPGFNYRAIRAYGINSISVQKEEYHKYRHRLIFELQKPQYLDYKPAIQICIFEKEGLSLKNFHIVHPAECSKDFVV